MSSEADGQNVYLYELVVLAVTMHESKACYRLYSTNCYWFAGLLMNILERDYGLEFEVEKQRVVKPGRWTIIPLFKQAQVEDILAVIVDFRERVRTYLKMVISMFRPLVINKQLS